MLKRTSFLFLAAAVLIFTVPRAAAEAHKATRDRPYPRVMGDVREILPMNDGAHVLVFAAMKCHYIPVDEIEHPNPERDDSEEIGHGYPCTGMATNGDDEVLLNARGTFLISNPQESGTDLEVGYKLRLTAAEQGVQHAGLENYFSNAKTVRFAADGKALAVGNAAGKIIIVSLPDGKYHELDHVQDAVQALRFTNEGGVLLALDRAGRIGAWDWQSERESEIAIDLSRRTSAIATAAGSPVFARWVAGAGVEAYSTDDWKRKASIKLGDVGIAAFELDPSGRWLAFASQGSSAVVDLKTGKVAGYIPFEPLMISALSFLPDGRRLIVGTKDGRLLSYRIPGDLRKDVWSPTDDPAKSGGPDSVSRRSFKTGTSLDAAIPRSPAPPLVPTPSQAVPLPLSSGPVVAAPPPPIPR